LLNIQQFEDIINVKGSKLHYILLLIFYLGGIFGMMWAVIEGLSFSSVFSFTWLVGGIVLLPVFIYLFIWFIPGLPPGKSIISLIKGPNGYFKTSKGNVPFSLIKEAELRRNGLTLINVLVLTTYDGKEYRIPTYNLIDELDVDVLIDRYVYPYMTPESQTVWDRQVNLEELYKEVEYKRESF